MSDDKRSLQCPLRSRLTIRLDILSRNDLLLLAAKALNQLSCSHHLRIFADALVASEKPLPLWCVNRVLLAPDILSRLFDSLALRDCVVAMVCSVWSAAWAQLLHRRRYLNPEPRCHDLASINGLYECSTMAAMPEGALAITARDRLFFFTAQGETLKGYSIWQSLAKVEFGIPSCILLLDGTLLLVDSERQHVRRLRLSDGVELSRSPQLEAPYNAVVAGDLLLVPTTHSVSVLSLANLQTRFSFGKAAGIGFGQAVDCAVHNDEVYITDTETQRELHVSNLQGRPLRTVSGHFGAPACITIKEGRIYMFELRPPPHDDSYRERCDRGEGKRLLVLELNGTVRQEIFLPDMIEVQSLCFLGDTLWVVAHAAEGSLSSDDEEIPATPILTEVLETPTSANEEVSVTPIPETPIPATPILQTQNPTTPIPATPAHVTQIPETPVPKPPMRRFYSPLHAFMFL